MKTSVRYQGNWLAVHVLPQARHNGLHYEVNIKGFPRFYLKWVASGRFDLCDPKQPSIPDELILLVSDEIEKEFGPPEV